MPTTCQDLFPGRDPNQQTTDQDYPAGSNRRHRPPPPQAPIQQYHHKSGPRDRAAAWAHWSAGPRPWNLSNLRTIGTVQRRFACPKLGKGRRKPPHPGHRKQPTGVEFQPPQAKTETAHATSQDYRPKTVVAKTSFQAMRKRKIRLYAKCQFGCVVLNS